MDAHGGGGIMCSFLFGLWGGREGKEEEEEKIQNSCEEDALHKPPEDHQNPLHPGKEIPQSHETHLPFPYFMSEKFNIFSSVPVCLFSPPPLLCGETDCG